MKTEEAVLIEGLEMINSIARGSSLRRIIVAAGRLPRVILLEWEEAAVDHLRDIIIISSSHQAEDQATTVPLHRLNTTINRLDRDQRMLLLLR